MYANLGPSRAFDKINLFENSGKFAFQFSPFQSNFRGFPNDLLVRLPNRWQWHTWLRGLHICVGLPPPHDPDCFLLRAAFQACKYPPPLIFCTFSTIKWLEFRVDFMTSGALSRDINTPSGNLLIKAAKGCRNIPELSSAFLVLAQCFLKILWLAILVPGRYV